MGPASEAKDEPSKAGLRALAAPEQKNRAARRMLALANQVKGMSPAGAAGAARMDLHARRDAARRYNAYRPCCIMADLSGK